MHVFGLHAGRKLSSANLFGDSNTAILTQSNNVNSRQFAGAGKWQGLLTNLADYCCWQQQVMQQLSGLSRQ